MQDFEKQLLDKTVGAIKELGYDRLYEPTPEEEKAGKKPSFKPEFRRIPFEGTWGFATACCLQLAGRAVTWGEIEKRETKPWADAAAVKVADALRLSGVGIPARIEAQNGYVNFYFDVGEVARRVVEGVISRGRSYGKGLPKDELVMVEYSQPNTHKGFHIGHVRNAVLGDSLLRIIDFAGYRSIGATYPGDIGLHVVKCLWGYINFHRGEEPPTGRGRWLGEIYNEAAVRLEGGGEQAERWQQEVKDLLQKWDAQDPELVELWRRTRQWSLDEFAEIYDTLGIRIDVEFYESEVEEEGKEIVQELVELGIAEDLRPKEPVLVKIDEKIRELLAREDAVVEDVGGGYVRLVATPPSRQEPVSIRMEKKQLKRLEKDDGEEVFRSMVILRSDGTSLYSTKDLALAKRKFEGYGVDRSVYVVDVRQSLHFQQVFKILELWGFKQAEKCYHLPYEIVTLPEGTMSSRAGNIILFEDLLAEAYSRAHEIVREKNPSLTPVQMEEVAKVVALGSIKFSMLGKDNNKVVVFSWEEALNFEGQTAPYIQYAHARACRIIEKAAEVGVTSDGEPDFSHLAGGGEGAGDAEEEADVYVTEGEAADLYGLNRVHLRYMAEQGRLKSRGEPGGEMKLALRDVKRYITEAEIELVGRLAEFPEVVGRAAEEYRPMYMANYAFELAADFNDFYYRCAVLRSGIPGQVQKARLALVEASRQVLATSLDLLGIAAPEVM